METFKSIQNYQNATHYERFMKAAYRCCQRDEKHGIDIAEFQLLYHIDNGYLYAGITYEDQIRRVQAFILKAMAHVENTRHIPEGLRNIWEDRLLDVRYSIEADFLATTITEIKEMMKVFPYRD